MKAGKKTGLVLLPLMAASGLLMGGRDSGGSDAKAPVADSSAPAGLMLPAGWKTLTAEVGNFQVALPVRLMEVMF